MFKYRVSGVGIDSVEVERFNGFFEYSDKQLLRLFSIEEIAYCRSVRRLSAQRFAVRFAAKEALYKALCQRGEFNRPAFFKLCSCVSVQRKNGVPYFSWSFLDGVFLGCAPSQVKLSLSHDRQYAHAFVVI